MNRDSAADKSLEMSPGYWSLIHLFNPADLSMAWETAGPIYQRSHEHLATADRGILIYRKMLKAEIDKVKRGKDPVGVMRDAAKNRLIAFYTITDSKQEVGQSR